MRWILLVGLMMVIAVGACIAPSSSGASSSSSSASSSSNSGGTSTASQGTTSSSAAPATSTGRSSSSGTLCPGGTLTTMACAAETTPRTAGRAAFVLEYQRLLCERELRCTTCEGCTAVPNACTAYDNGAWGYPADENVHDAACAQACLDALATSPCSEGAGVPPPCVEANLRLGPRPTSTGAALGEPCLGTVCQQGTYCEQYGAAGESRFSLPCAVCRPLLQDGQGCVDWRSPGCAEGYCASGGPGGVCNHPRRFLGESCDAREQCYSGQCTGGSCVPTPRYCRGTPLQNGEVCERSSPNCLRGSVCVRGAGDFVCTPALPAGQPCNPTEDHVACQGVCVAGASSSGGTCVTPQAAPTDGQPCGQSRFGPACAPGHLTRIDANGCTCHRQRNDGETCTSDLDCRNLCIRGTCATRKLNGEPCVDGQDCMSAVCSGGTCAAACGGSSSSSSSG